MNCPQCGNQATYQTPDGTYWDSNAHYWRGERVEGEMRGELDQLKAGLTDVLHGRVRPLADIERELEVKGEMTAEQIEKSRKVAEIIYGSFSDHNGMSVDDITYQIAKHAAYQLAERALDSHLPAGYAIGDEATATLAVQLAEREAQYQKAMRALESLTPSGSEFVGDVERCVKFIRDSRSSQHRVITSWAKRAHEAESREQRLREALQRIAHMSCETGHTCIRVARETAEEALNPSPAKEEV